MSLNSNLLIEKLGTTGKCYRENWALEAFYSKHFLLSWLQNKFKK